MFTVFFTNAETGNEARYGGTYSPFEAVYAVMQCMTDENVSQIRIVRIVRL